MHVSVQRVFNNVARNLGLNEYTEHFDSWAEWAFEAEQYIGSLNTFLEKEITYSATPEQATAEIEYDSNPAEKSYIEIDGTRFYFRNLLLSSTINETDRIVSIESTLDLTMAELVVKIQESYYNNLKGISAVWDSATKKLILA